MMIPTAIPDDERDFLMFYDRFVARSRGLAAFALLLIASCQRGCDPSPTQLPPACYLPKECESGQVLVCGNKCVTPVPEGKSCTQDDPCGERGTCENHGVCRPSVIGLGDVCTHGPVADQVFDNCTFVDGGKNSCTDGLACVRAAQCPARLPKDLDELGSFCVLPVEEGDHCDSTLTRTGDDSPFDTRKHCSPCKAGLLCEDRGDGERCFRPCVADRDCPCREGDHGMDSGACREGACHQCRTFGEDCDPFARCCGSGIACGSTTEAEGRCCRTIDTPCVRDADCCQEKLLEGPEVCALFPGQGYRCLTCAQEGQDCTDGSQCCDGLSCGYDDTCIRPCEAGAPCFVPGIEEGNSCRFGIEICPYVFDPPVCVTNPLVIELETVPGNECDGLDNDCNGFIDEDYASHTCFRQPDECPEPFQVRSTTICSEGAEYCRPVFAGYDYCSPATAGDATCGALLGMPCDVPTLPCEPNAVCVPIEGTTGICGVGCPQPMPSCWLPAQVSDGLVCLRR